MNKYLFKAILFIFLIYTQLPSAFTQQNNSWNQFRGPDRNGVITDYNIPPGKPQLLWKKEIGPGFSEIAVEGNRIYTMFGEKNDSILGSEFLCSLNAENGELIWKTKVDSLFFDTFGDGPRSTPVVGENYIFCLSSFGKLSAISKIEGKIIWQRDFVSEFGSTIPQWAFSTSPLLIDNILILEVGGTESRAFVGFDINTGKVIWQKGNGSASYCSPLVANIAGKSNIIFANQKTLYSFTSKGDSIWSFPMSMNGPTGMPVFFDSDKIFVSTIRSNGFSIMEVDNNIVKEVYKAETLKNDYSSSLYYDGCFYGFNVAALQCVSAQTGEKKWTKRGLGKGSLILVGDNLLVLSDQGKLLQIKATPDAYTELGSFQALDGKSWTAPSFAGGKLYVRNLTEMACYSY